MNATTRQKQADLASSGGAGILGLGLGALLAAWLGGYAAAFVAAGVALHGWGMLERRRLEAAAPQPAWATVLYWLCWAFLGLVLAWIAFTALKG